MLSCIKARKSAAAEDVYSLEERIVGRWIDGRPIYRKTIVGTTGALRTYKVIDTDSDVDIVLNGCGFVRQTNAMNGAGHFSYVAIFSTPIVVIGNEIETRRVWIWVDSASVANQPFTAAIEYIKTTDQPTIPLPEAETNILQEDWPGVAEDETVRGGGISYA